MTSPLMGVNCAQGAIDWVTCLTESPLDGQILRRVGDEMLGRAERVSPWRLRGYCGRTGRDLSGMTGGVSYGERLSMEQVSYMLQAWGEASTKVSRRLLALHKVRVSRMDYALTVLFDAPIPPVGGWEVEEDAMHPYRITRIVPGDSGGGTLYVGSRGSDVFGRVYDKGAELGTIPERMYWRWEVEYKRDHARQAYANWAECVNGDARTAYITSEVTGWFRQHGVPVPSVSLGDLDRTMVRYQTRLRTSETTIAWLRTQVNPAIRRLGSNGRLGDVLEALGLWDNQLEVSQKELDRLSQWSQYDFLAALDRGGAELPA